MARLLLIATLLTYNFAAAQRPSEIGVITDNDLYTSWENDQYYTAGLEVFYRYLGTHSNPKLAKRITEFRIGQYIYNPQTSQPKDINYHDRPFAGYLFAEAGINKFFLSEDVLKVNFQIGVVGPESQAEAVQKGLHYLLGYKRVRGWEYQIKTNPALQAGMFYSKKILKTRFYQKTDVHITAGLEAGTIWTGVSVGALARVSLKDILLPVYDSSLYGAALDKDPAKYKGRREFYLYFWPMVNYQAYDATIQGSLFNETSPVTFGLIPFRFNAEAGIKYRRNNWNLSYSFNYRGKELSNIVITGYYYGSISVSYFLHK
ncbi:hypothetical protein CHU92_05565 [Flavobacterium cyanobacteriorum]|uniref:Lipid A deacylase LpxR family protein n=1 Tax=Flavobacterium cyanobacteriorum TaxID=2022802 RepID=A0A255ZBQ2_9FLAO|nr:lipid A deacylase LpxR family protein [Flavobacterium cyanobacteriorum]OYQ38344.1 hypothetical protein CHU92_05565 [Flavobacterium cyanobacteriorum]